MKMKTTKLAITATTDVILDCAAHFSTTIGDGEILLDLDPENLDTEDSPDFMFDSPEADTYRELFAIVDAARESGADYLLLTQN